MPDALSFDIESKIPVKNFITLLVIALVAGIFSAGLFRGEPTDDQGAGDAGAVVEKGVDAGGESGENTEVKGDEAVGEAADKLVEKAEKAVETPAVKKAVEADKDMGRLKPQNNAGASRVATLGSLDSVNGYKLQVQLSGHGGSVYKIRASEHNQEKNSEDKYLLQEYTVIDKKNGIGFFPMAAKRITIDGQVVQLEGADAIWNLVGVSSGEIEANTEKASWTGHAEDTEEAFEVRRGKAIYTEAVYSLDIVDAKNVVVARLLRKYELVKDRYDVYVTQEIKNLTGKPIKVIWEQNAQTELPESEGDRQDSRTFYAGYFDLTRDQNKVHLYTDDSQLGHAALKDTTIDAIWPLADTENKTELVWAGATNRFFTVAVYPTIGKDVKSRNQVVGLDANYDFLGVEVEEIGDRSDVKTLAVFTLRTKALEIAAGESVVLPLTMYAGPRQKEILEAKPYSFMEFADKLIVYSMGCFCSFQFLTTFLYGFLKTLHDYVFFDWAMSIVGLVIVVKLVMHPITKKSQANMMKMGEQMKMLKPKMDKIKEKYADDKARVQQETQKLYKENNVNPLNMLGCLPMFLQMPIWVSLYAMLSFAFELRHEAAFWGVFEKMGWGFMSDLSVPDHFYKFETPLNLMVFELDAINILPLLWGVVMLISSKFSSPPATDDQAAMNQKIQRYMLLLMPLLMYSTPSALTLYFLISSIAGTFDSYLVRKHIQEQKDSGELFKAKEVKLGGFRDRLGKRFQAMQENAAKMQGAKQSGNLSKQQGLKNSDNVTARNQFKQRKKK